MCRCAAAPAGTGCTLCEPFPGVGRGLVALQNVSTTLPAGVSPSGTQWDIVSESCGWHGEAWSGGTGVKDIKSTPKSFTRAF